MSRNKLNHIMCKSILKLYFLIWAVPLLFILAGCATVVPTFDVPNGPDGGPTVQSIVQTVRCELSRLVDSNYLYEVVLIEQDIDVAVQLSLTVNDTGGLAPSLSYLGGPKFMFDGSALFSSSREQNFTEKLFFSMRDLAKDVHRNRGTLSDPRICPLTDTNLSGDLGLKSMVDMAITSSYLDNNSKLNGVDGAFGGYIKFIIMKNANMVGPTWTLRHFKGPGPLFGLSEVNTDQLTIAFARGDRHGTPFRFTEPNKTRTAGKARELLDSIIFNQIATSIGSINR